MFKPRPHTIALMAVMLFGILLFYIGTDGFSAYTAEAARVNRLIEEKPKFPNVTLEDSKARTYSFSEFEGKHVLVTFMYTTCKSICVQLEMNTALVYEQLPEAYIGEDIVFLSISFDPQRDDPATLETYRGYFNSDGETWRMARINDQRQLYDLLQAFGVIVIPDGIGNFTHNAAFYLIDREGYLADVMDFNDYDEAAAKINDRLEHEAEG
jgi:protein SCO1